MDFVRTFLSVDLKHVGTPRSLQGFFLSVVGSSVPVSLWNGHSWGKFRKNDRVFKDQVYKRSTEQPKGSDSEKQSGCLYTFWPIPVDLSPSKHLNTKLSVSISSEYWICQFYLNPFELLRNEFMSRVDRQDGSFKKPLTGSLRFKSILLKSRSKIEVVSIGDKELVHANSKSLTAIELFCCK